MKLTPDAAAALADDELNTRARAAAERVEQRMSRCAAEQRDFTSREHELSVADRDELEVLRAESEARAARAATEARHAEIGREVARLTDTRAAAGPFRPTLLVSDGNHARHAAALREGRPFGVIETRARVTAGGDLGSAGAWNPGAPNEPRHLIAFAGIPVSELTGKTAQVPKYTGPSGAAGVDESANHGEYDAVDPVSLTALRYGRWSEVSALANVVDDLTGMNAMHGWGIARDLDLLAVAAVQTAASTPVALGDDLETQVREAILTVAAATYSDETQLVIVGKPADLSLLTGTAPANGSDLGSVATRYAGARLYPSLAATAGQVTVFAPNAFRVFMSRLQSASLIDPASGANKFGSWLHSTGVAQQITGSAVAVATAE